MARPDGRAHPALHAARTTTRTRARCCRRCAQASTCATARPATPSAPACTPLSSVASKAHGDEADGAHRDERVDERVAERVDGARRNGERCPRETFWPTHGERAVVSCERRAAQRSPVSRRQWHLTRRERAGQRAGDATRARPALRWAARTVLKEHGLPSRLLDGAIRKQSWATAHWWRRLVPARASSRQQRTGYRRCQAVAQQVRTTLARLARTTNQLDEASAVIQPATPGAGPQAPARRLQSPTSGGG